MQHWTWNAVVLAGLALPADCLAADPPKADSRLAVSETACLLELVAVTAPDGHQTDAVVRRPPGPGPFPVLVHLHGGLGRYPVDRLKQFASEVNASRFLAAGYMTVHPTFRSRAKDPQTRDALVDCLAVIDYVKKRPEVDRRSVVVWGDSGGGSLALELAGETPLCAVAAQEPATVLFTGMFTKDQMDLKALMASPRDYYTPGLQQFTRAKISKIQCPVFIAHGNVHPINKLNNEIVIPEMKAAGKPPEVVLYAGQPHGFSRTSKPFFTGCDAFFRRRLATQPVALPEGIVTQVPVGQDAT
jgi:acetyl esterase/lipase